MTTDFSATRAMFTLPEGVIYLDGNSLGPLPRAVQAKMASVVTDEWGTMLIRGWNQAGWMEQPRRLGDRIGRLIGAEPGCVVLGDTLSIKVYQALASALEMRPDRKVILSDTGNFPSDLYMAEGLLRTLGEGYSLRTVAPEDVLDAIDESVAAIMITEVDYRTGRRHDMKALTERAHSLGALAIWDLAHSAGALPLQVAGDGADFAVGCTYKYLNSGRAARPLSTWHRAISRSPVQPFPDGWGMKPPLPSISTIGPETVSSGCVSARLPSCNWQHWRPHSMSGTALTCRICVFVRWSLEICSLRASRRVALN